MRGEEAHRRPATPGIVQSRRLAAGRAGAWPADAKAYQRRPTFLFSSQIYVLRRRRLQRLFRCRRCCPPSKRQRRPDDLDPERAWAYRQYCEIETKKHDLFYLIAELEKRHQIVGTREKTWSSSSIFSDTLILIPAIPSGAALVQEKDSTIVCYMECLPRWPLGCTWIGRVGEVCLPLYLELVTSTFHYVMSPDIISGVNFVKVHFLLAKCQGIALHYVMSPDIISGVNFVKVHFLLAKCQGIALLFFCGLLFQEAALSKAQFFW
ncbi:uncharacterized protein [Triticum aestivum]|uniref:uncharacterized protein n=1 Tax=Triticum aestivum TaxID=4565 RepID=UPI001D004A52|nr:uncharacterized protein LOC123057116 [Triticum aestivum]